MNEDKIEKWIINNHRKRCAGCGILLDKLLDDILDDTVIYRHKGFKFCRDCYDRIDNKRITPSIIEVI